jgi:hypothetical protein
MTWAEWLLQLTVAGLLLAAMPFTLRLHRQLAALRRAGGAFEGTAQGLQEATRQAEAASLRLRASAENAGRQMAEKLAVAEPLRDDLRYLVERAEALADRLEALVRQGRPLVPEPGATAPAGPRAEAGGGQSQAERDLLRALVRGERAGGRA